MAAPEMVIEAMREEAMAATTPVATVLEVV